MLYAPVLLQCLAERPVWLCPGVPGEPAANIARQESLDTGSQAVGEEGVARLRGQVQVVVLGEDNIPAD